MDSVKLSLNRLTYNLRWRHKIEADFEHDSATFNENSTSVLNNIPFHKNSVKLPHGMSNDQEVNLLLFKEEVLKTVQQETNRTKRTGNYKRQSREFIVSKSFLKNHDLSVVATDKTSRFCVTSNSSMSDRIESLLNDCST